VIFDAAVHALQRSQRPAEPAPRLPHVLYEPEIWCMADRDRHFTRYRRLFGENPAAELAHRPLLPLHRPRSSRVNPGRHHGPGCALIGRRRPSGGDLRCTAAAGAVGRRDGSAAAVAGHGRPADPAAQARWLDSESAVRACWWALATVHRTRLGAGR
jgi:hypothetical protein